MLTLQLLGTWCKSFVARLAIDVSLVLLCSGPREDATRIGSAGVIRRQAVDISPLRRVNQVRPALRCSNVPLPGSVAPQRMLSDAQHGMGVAADLDVCGLSRVFKSVSGVMSDIRGT